MTESIARTIALEAISSFQKYGVTSKQLSISVLLSPSDFQKFSQTYTQLEAVLLESDSKLREFIPTDIRFSTGFDLNTVWIISFQSQLVRRTYGLNSMLLRNADPIDEILNTSSKPAAFSQSSFEEIPKNLIDRLGKQEFVVQDLDICMAEISNEVFDYLKSHLTNQYETHSLWITNSKPNIRWSINFTAVQPSSVTIPFEELTDIGETSDHLIEAFKPGDVINGIAWSHNSENVIAFGNFGFQIYSITTNSISYSQSQFDNCKSASWSPNDTKIAAAAHNKIYFWDTQSYELQPRVLTSTNNINLLAWSKDGQYIIYADDSGEACVFDVDSLELISRLHGDKRLIWETLQLSPDGHYLAVAMKTHETNLIHVWDNFSTNQASRIEISEHEGLQFFTWYSDQSLLIFDRNGNCGIWDVNANKKVDAFDCIPEAQFSPIGNMVASGHDNVVEIWEFENREWNPVTELVSHSDDVDTVVWSPDGMKLASCSTFGVVSIWDVSFLY